MSDTNDRPETTDAASPQAASLHAPVARLLRPLVRLFVARGITFPALTNLLRELYVNVAEYDFALAGKEQTDSRVSLLTGIHRKEVRRLRGAGAPVSQVPGVVSRTSRIIARWVAAPEFTDGQGRPLPLPRVAEEDGPSFEALVAGVTRDVRPRAVLDEWLDRGLVVLDDQGRVVLLEGAYLPRGGSEPQLYYFGRNLHDHVAAAVENIMGEAPRFLERAVHYDGLSQPLAERLEARAREIAMDALRQANAEAHEACIDDPGGAHRWNFGIYVFREETSPASTPPATAANA
ncbi:DUF6502 family protein [Methylobacterium haplocladii]|uniref:Uncharacterized protein n=1 Tax=Methylobacterium haplocladii TaxID=1176176 RepID=A0A512ISX1_9HYPH|nr:DUF6502 family protein [Methylobacterium haplocladii]GEP00766.1 hypothetical protein MHA02_31530 [Methylobacterium haplocladii]GJD83101.1 hypothetical protein HPGCJGGD_0963 [Methylobacterium haplocladii]GLS59501.1 hypothetical protein GCM10007887_21700 [Methylobacterium haplocladii]